MAQVGPLREYLVKVWSTHLMSLHLASRSGVVHHLLSMKFISIFEALHIFCIL
jgi:hypothetical protein